MYNEAKAEKTKKWDMVFLFFCVFLFLITASSTIYLYVTDQQQIEKKRATFYADNLYLNELEEITRDIAEGNDSGVMTLTSQLSKMRRHQSTSNWSSLLKEATALENAANQDGLQKSFYAKETVIKNLNLLAQDAQKISSANTYKHPAIVDFLNNNANMDLIADLIYSDNYIYAKNAMSRIEATYQLKDTILPYIKGSDELLKLYYSMLETIEPIVSNKANIETLLNHRESLSVSISDLIKATNNKLKSVTTESMEIISTPFIDIPRYILYTIALLSILFFIIAVYMIYRILVERNRAEKSALLQSQKNEEAIFEFLDVIYALSEGDLTVQAKVTDHFTGTLADSFNMSVEELRELVKAVDQSSDHLTKGVSSAISSADKFTEASLSQAMQIQEATNIVSHVAQAMLDVSTQTSAAVDIAMSSTEVARSGSERVRSTIVGMDHIREHIQETSKRIKRLGESSQEIGDVVELINDIADQTHILALNAAIQASAAGEAGKGFAVVAEEVQRLAERTGNATSRVEALVKAIQSDTNEAIFAMEKSTTEVVTGANLAERAGESLNEIESVSVRLAGLIQSVSQASREVSELGNQVKTSMDSVRSLSEKNVENTKSSKSTIEALSELANDLKSAISGFKI